MLMLAAGAGTLGPTGTFVTAGAEEGPQGGSDYQAAVQAASQGADGWVLTWACCSACSSTLCQDVSAQDDKAALEAVT